MCMCKNPPECFPLRAVNASLWSLAPVLMCAKGWKTYIFKSPQSLEPKEKEKKVVHSPFSALALQMLMKSVLSWALNRSKMLWFGSICIPSWIGRQPQQTGLALHITSSKKELTGLEKIECGQKADCKVRGRRMSPHTPPSLLSGAGRGGEGGTKLREKCIVNE